MGALNNALGFDLTILDPIQNSPFHASSAEGTPSAPITGNFLLLDGTDFLLLDKTDFLLL